MTYIRTTIDIGGREFIGQLATVEYTRLEYEDHGFLVAGVSLDIHNGGGVTFGGHVLGMDKETWPYTEHNPAYLRLWVDKVLVVSGRRCWEQVAGAKLYALFERDGLAGDVVKGICSLSGQHWFVPEDYERTEKPVDYT